MESKGETMRRLYLLLSVLILVSTLAGCVPKAITPSAQVKPSGNPTAVDLPEQATPTEITQSESVQHDPPTSCPISVPPKPEFVPPSIPFLSPLASFPNEFWFGSEHLWTAIPNDAIWYSLPHNPEGYTQKIFWWSDLFSLKDEPKPELIVTGQRLDAKAPPLNASKATNAYGGDIGEAMLTGVDFPTLGCWKITGQYKKSELSFVVWIAP
jgi:hypothetical protein